MVRALIIDDETGAREVLNDLIGNFCPAIKVVGMASDTFEAEEMLKKLAIDLVFLDIEMPRRSGIQFLQSLENISFDVIFTTAFDQYALQAIKLSALDYLMKPIEIKDLIHAVHKFQLGIENQRKLQNLLENTSSKNKKIVLPQMDAIDFVLIDHILFCSAEGSYTRFVLKEGKDIVVSKSIKNYEDVLIPEGFFRCHKSFLVNTSSITRYERNGTLTISNGSKIQVSRSKREEILLIIANKPT